VTRSQIVRFEFFGGEPLLNFARIQEICARSDAFSADTGIRFINRISTNLTVLPSGACELFRDRRFIVSVSIDGGAATHDHNRPTKGGQGSFDGIIENCRRVRDIGGDSITMVARMTVVTSSPPLVENVRALWRLNLFDYFQVYPGVTAAYTCNGGDGLLQITSKAAARPATMESTFLDQLEGLLSEYPTLFSATNRFKGGLECERLVQMVLEGRMALGFCSAGKTYYTFSPDDSISSCHRMVGSLEHVAGSGPDGITRDLNAWTLPVDRHPVCSQCWARYACGGNCRQENFVATGHLRALNEDTCRYQREQLAGVLRLIARTSSAYHALDRTQLDDLFVSCGRPVVPNRRGGDVSAIAGLRFFRPIGKDASGASARHPITEEGLCQS
jgi:radical SAM protein with 4Fe4S-binding SPASM domain